MSDWFFCTNESWRFQNNPHNFPPFHMYGTHTYLQIFCRSPRFPEVGYFCMVCHGEMWCGQLRSATRLCLCMCLCVRFVFWCFGNHISFCGTETLAIHSGTKGYTPKPKHCSRIQQLDTSAKAAEHADNNNRSDGHMQAKSCFLRNDIKRNK